MCPQKVVLRTGLRKKKGLNWVSIEGRTQFIEVRNVTIAGRMPKVGYVSKVAG